MVLENLMWCDGWWLNMIMMTDDWNDDDNDDHDNDNSHDDDNHDNHENWLWILNMIIMTDDWNDNDNNDNHDEDNDDNDDNPIDGDDDQKDGDYPPAKPRQPVYTENLESQPPQLPKTKSRFDLRDQKNLFRPPSDHIDTL